MTRFILIGKANTLSAQLAAIQKQGLVPSGPEIRADAVAAISSVRTVGR